MSVELDEYKVRFGDMSYGPLMHPTTYYNLLIRGVEELSHVLDRPIEDLVAAGWVPYAPVSVETDIARYPSYDTTIRTSGRTVSIGERSFEFEYTFHQDDGRHLATGRVTHVSLTPDGEAERIPQDVRAKLRVLRDAQAEPSREPAPGVSDAVDEESTFRKNLDFRTPMIEAVDLGYFEEYFRSMNVALEEYLEGRGISMRDGGRDRYPFLQTGGYVEFLEPVRFEDSILVCGAVTDVDSETIDVEYSFEGHAEGDTRIEGSVEFGCFDPDGERVTFPPEVLERLGGNA